MRFAPFKTRLGRFTRDTEGYITVEAVIVLPALLWLFAAGWVYFDALRQQSVNQKANYTIGDMVSRETTAINAGYVDNAHNLLQLLTKSADAGVALRLSVVQWDADAASWTLRWSEARGAAAALTAAEINGSYADRLPVVANGDQLVLVETWDPYRPIFSVGLDAFDITSYSFTRPRYAPQVVFTAG